MATTSGAAHSGLQQQLRELLLAFRASGKALSPSTGDALLQSIVEAAARLFGASAASISLVDEATRTLHFRVAWGAGVDQIIGTSIPLDKGIAGYVAMTGQPLAVSDVQRDARFARDFAASTGFVPLSILAMPLLADNVVIGVIEVLDKLGADSFGMQDMELLSLFARPAALAIRQAQLNDQVTGALVAALERLAAADQRGAADALRAAQTAGSAVDPAQARVLALAAQFQAFAALGEAEIAACQQVLAAFADYARRSDRHLT